MDKLTEAVSETLCALEVMHKYTPVAAAAQHLASARAALDEVLTPDQVVAEATAAPEPQLDPLLEPAPPAPDEPKKKKGK